jgi:hypothetical protein
MTKRTQASGLRAVHVERCTRYGVCKHASPANCGWYVFVTCLPLLLPLLLLLLLLLQRYEAANAVWADTYAQQQIAALRQQQQQQLAASAAASSMYLPPEAHIP